MTQKEMMKRKLRHGRKGRKSDDMKGNDEESVLINELRKNAKYPLLAVTMCRSLYIYKSKSNLRHCYDIVWRVCYQVLN